MKTYTKASRAIRRGIKPSEKSSGLVLQVTVPSSYCVEAPIKLQRGGIRISVSALDTMENWSYIVLGKV